MNVFLSGCFDVIHVGHVRILQFARDLGGKLHVAVNTDESVRKLKGDNRPINTLHHRIEVIRAIVPSAMIWTFVEDRPLDLIKQIRPDLMVLGNEPSKYMIPEIELVNSLKGRIVWYNYTTSQSTTNIISMIMGS